MSQDRSRFPASFSDSDEEDESASFSDFEEEDESASYSDSATTNTIARGACPCCRKSEEIAELKQKLSNCKSYHWQASTAMRSMIEIIKQNDETIKQNDEMFKRYAEMFKRYDEMFQQNLKMFKRNHKIQKWTMKMIQELRQSVITDLLPPEEQEPMQQQQPLLPAAAAAAVATLQPQPQLGRTGEDEGEKNASEDLM